jgi:hypothetical protein
VVGLGDPVRRRRGADAENHEAHGAGLPSPG